MNILVYDSEAERYRDLLAQARPDVSVIATAAYDEALNRICEADALFALAPAITDELVRNGNRLRWIQALTTGVDTFDALSSLRPEILLSSARGIHGPQMAEMALLLMLSLSRDFPRMQRNQRDRMWDRWPQQLLWRRTVCVVGLGVIAEELARRCRTFEMQVIGVSAEHREVDGFDQVFARRDLAHAFCISDYVVLLTPYTAATHHLIDTDALAAMRQGAYLVNLARGGVVDEPALIQALSSGAIAGAAVDVFEQEPLAQDNPIWSAPNLIVTSHMGGFSDCYPEQILPILTHNIGAVAERAPDRMRNRVWAGHQVAAA